MMSGFAGSPLAKEYQVRDHARSLILKGSGGQADRSQEIGSFGEQLAAGAICLVEGKVRRDDGEYPAGHQLIEALGNKEIMQGQPLALEVQANVSERRVSDAGIQWGNPAILKCPDANIVLREPGFRDSA